MADTDTDQPTVVFWSAAPDPEDLWCTTVAEAVEDWAECFASASDVPETVEVVGYARMSARGVLDPKWILDYMLETLDEGHGDPYSDDGTEPTDKMIEAARAFVETIEQEYVPWNCEEVCRKTVQVCDYIDLQKEPDHG